MIIDIEKGYDAFITAYPFDFCNRENWSSSTNWNLSVGVETLLCHKTPLHTKFINKVTLLITNFIIVAYLFIRFDKWSSSSSAYPNFPYTD